jgi:hypothetical protein
MRNDRDSWSGWTDLAARLAQSMPAVGGLLALALGIGAAAPRNAFAQSPLPPATFVLSLDVLGAYNGGLSAPGTDTINYCREVGSCGTATGSLYANIAKVQSIGGTADTFQDLGSQGGVTIDYYYRFNGPAGGTVDYHFSSSGATSEGGHGDATAFLYMNGTLVDYACSGSQPGYCVQSDAFQVDTELSAPANTTEKIELDLNGDTGAFGGDFSASIDPMITIDPSSVDQGYSLELSPNVTQESVAPSAPEPSTWAMLLAGFASLGFAYRARRRACAAHDGRKSGRSGIQWRGRTLSKAGFTVGPLVRRE